MNHHSIPQINPQYTMERTTHDNNIRGDLIERLPTDNHPMHHKELDVVRSVFGDTPIGDNNFFSDVKDLVLLLTIFIVVSLPQMSSVIHRFVPASQQSEYIDILVRGLLLVCIYYIMKHVHLVRV